MFRPPRFPVSGLLGEFAVWVDERRGRRGSERVGDGRVMCCAVVLCDISGDG